MSPNRLNEIEITKTVPRQTPRTEFPHVMGQAVAAAASMGADFLAPVASSNPLLSAAVSAVKTIAQGAMAQAGTASVGVGSGSDPVSMLDANRQMMQEGAQLNMQYLQLQHDMQQESQQYNAISNVMKVRHDSAKAAINNVR